MPPGTRLLLRPAPYGMAVLVASPARALPWGKSPPVRLHFGRCWAGGGGRDVSVPSPVISPWPVGLLGTPGRPPIHTFHLGTLTFSLRGDVIESV